MFEQRYSILSCIASLVVGFYVLIFIMLFIHKRIFSGSHTFPGQSLLLSTNVLNDNITKNLNLKKEVGIDYRNKK